MTTEDKFNAAVNVIRNLPKNGSYQPSNDLQLRFYAYYKQATEGPCMAPRPGFWEVIKKIKWEAWNRLGNMSREEAMTNYVEELKKIVETMSYTENVADFLGSLGPFYDNVPMEDLEMLIGNVIERVRSQPGSPLGGSPITSRDTSPVRRAFSSLETSPASSYSASPLPPEQDGDEEEEEEFIDSVEAEPERLRKDSVGKKNATHLHMNGSAAVAKELDGMKAPAVNGCSEQEDGRDRGRPRHTTTITNGSSRNPEQNHQQLNVSVSEKIHATVLHLQQDLDRITARVRSLEVSALSGAATASVQTREPNWWPFAELSVPTAAFVIGWPLIVHVIVKWLERRRQRRP